MSDSTVGQTKQFGKGQRVVPAQKAQKWYPVDDESQPKKVSTPCLLQEFWFGLFWRNKRCGFLWTNAKIAPVRMNSELLVQSWSRPVSIGT